MTSLESVVDTTRVLHIELSCCVDCPYFASAYEIFHDPTMETYHCLNAAAGNHPTIEPAGEIPGWCPLPGIRGGGITND